MQTLNVQRAAGLSSLLAIGCRSGDTVVGLSAIRRCEHLAYVFVDGSLAQRTLREMSAWEQRGARVFLVDEYVRLTEAFGRQDARVVGVYAGSLADGIAGRLA